MKILVTGGAGFIGSHTVVELQNAGYDAVVLDNLSNSSEKSLERVEKITGKKVPFYKADILDRKALNEIFDKENVDAVIHFAGLKAVGESVAMPWEYYENNIAGTLTLIDVMRKHGVKNIIFSSSATVYGDPAIIPITEFAEDQNLFMVTRKGTVKKTNIMEYINIRKNGLIAINLRDDDELIEVKTTTKDSEIFLVTKQGMCIRFKETDVRATGRSSMGVIGMNLNPEDEIVGMQLDHQGDSLLIVSEKGYGKRTYLQEFTVQHRGGTGVKCYKIMEKTG